MARVFHRKDRKGRKVWYVDYSIEGKRRRERVGYVKEEVEEALQSRLTDIRRRKFDHILPEGTCTLEDIRTKYLEYASTVKSAASKVRDEGILTTHLIPFFGKSSLNQITPEQVEDYRAFRSTAPNRTRRPGKVGSRSVRTSKATINKEVQLLKNIVKKAVEWGKIRTNRIADLKPLKTPPGRVRYLEQGQVEKLLARCPDWLRPIVVIDINTGMRRSELLGLRREDLDRKNRLITLWKTKNNERRVIPMNQAVFDVLSSLPVRLDTPFVFADKSGRPPTPDQVSIAFKRACRKAGIENFRLHDLRHHFASYLTMRGQSLRAVQELLGHKSPVMTSRYAHLSPKYLREAVESLVEPVPKRKKA